MTIHGVSSPLDVIARPEEPLADAASRMRFNDVGCVPVVDQGRLVGILTERDLARSVADGADSRHVIVADYMTIHPIVVDHDMDAVEASRIMIEAGVRHLPILENGRLVGIVSMRDIVAELLWSGAVTVTRGPQLTKKEAV
jgi:CBS domain-containing protein